MTSKTLWRLRLLTRKLWVRASLISLLAVAAALFAFVISPYLPEDLSTEIGAESADKLLSIIASSMLAVTTFSLSTMVTAYGAATSNVTPRATRLIMEDSTTQNVLAAFVGSFLYSLVAIITLAMGGYGERGRIVLFFVTLLVVILIVVTLLRWIDYLMRLGRVGETTRRVEEAAIRAMTERRDEPFLGGSPLPGRGGMPTPRFEIGAPEIGYVEHIDTAALQKLADAHDAEIHVLALPGAFIDARRPLAVVTSADEELHANAASAFSIAAERSFDQDPRFGLIVLAEIAQRALSPAVNDPGTAIDVIGRAVRVLSLWGQPSPARQPRYPRIHVPAIEAGELFDDFFLPVARDGAGMVEVQVRLQKALAALSRLEAPGFREAAGRHAAIALERMRNAQAPDIDLRRAEAAAPKLGRA
ncbi:DUF2254 domain-containing protein [Bosea minatitlanensis]|uniref:DUF2254 domain-containing protein n=1 Tax=Bosea minatitlanensis TaxID=128782 RepID=A0ABW0F639_9HYPH|nr:DUF2254 domain-containing protein [Bosea minatitlanensis]MCT4493690.1 DUF2254 domain-containing protein [Bosea minatitlanensis]